MKKKIIIPLLIVCSALFLIWPVVSGQSEKTEYLTEAVRQGHLRQTAHTTGEVGAVQLVSVGAQVSGQIKILHVTLGQEVHKGDLIAEIDSTTQTNELNTNKARLETYQSQLVSKEVSLKIAQTQYDRELKLRAKGASTADNLEDAENNLAAAKAAVDELQSLIKQTQISVSTSEVNLGYTRIVAPMDGTVVSIPVEEGQTVNANQTTPTIVQLADLRSMEIKMQISEGDVTKVKPGQTVNYSILSEPDLIFQGQLKSIDPGLTLLTDGSYTGSTQDNTAVYYYGKLVVPNEDGQLRIGLTTQNEIVIARAENALLVPTLAIKEHDGQKVVQVLENGDRVREQVVSTGLTDNINTQVLSGLKAGEKVVVAQMSATELAASQGRNNGRPPRM